MQGLRASQSISSCNGVVLSCLRASDAICQVQGTVDKVLVARGHVTVELLLTMQQAHSHTQLRLNLDPSARCGAPQASFRASGLCHMTGTGA